MRSRPLGSNARIRTLSGVEVFSECVNWFTKARQPPSTSVIESLEERRDLRLLGTHQDQPVRSPRIARRCSVTRTICAAWEASGGSVVLAALSGKAALRLSRASGRLAMTLARLLRTGTTARVGRGRSKAIQRECARQRPSRGLDRRADACGHR
ncbi:AAA family ATPase [Mesorhizobium jarvisii]